MLNNEPNKKKLSITIDENSGFCFGVVNAIKKVEQELTKENKLISLGEIVHNEQEVSRLSTIGLSAIHNNDFDALKNGKVLFRAHGEPPESYHLAEKNNTKVIDATCPVVLKLQKRIKEAYNRLKEIGGQIIIFGKEKHAEVIGLAGQTDFNCIVIEKVQDIYNIDLNKPTEVFSQTTMSLIEYEKLADIITERSNNNAKVNDTICRQVANRSPILAEFAKKFDVILFVGGAKSSNAKFLYSVCKEHNPKSFFIGSTSDINTEWFKNADTLGICGATSTPMWLMEKIATHISNTP